MKNKNSRKKVKEFLMVSFLAGVLFYTYGDVILSNTNTDTSSYLYTGGTEAVLHVDSETLQEVMEKYSDVEQLKGVEKEALLKKLDDIHNSDINEVSKKEALEALGEICIYDDDVQFAASSNSDITLYKPTLSYLTSTSSYSIYATGKLPSSAIKDELSSFSLWYPSVGDTKNVGGVDAMAFLISNTSGSTSGLAVKSGYGKLAGKGSKISTTLATADDRYGAGYTVQDIITVTSVSNYVIASSYKYEYNASSISSQVLYNSNFSKYSGNVKFYYNHTWDNTRVNSIGLSASGISFGWNDKSDQWTGYSYARTFKNGKSTN